MSGGDIFFLREATLEVQLASWRFRPIALVGAGIATAALLLTACGTGTTQSSSSFTVVRSNVHEGSLNLSLSDLSCSTPSDCWAVGENTVPQGQMLPMNGTLLMHFDGTSWRQVLHTGADVTNSIVTQLSQLSCPRKGWCMATGASNSGGKGAFFAIISGNRLELHRTAQVGAFSTIDCRSPTLCVGVGLYSGGRFAAAAWNGTSWLAMRTPGVLGQEGAISCPTTTYCMAVGSSFGRTGPGPGAMQWDGSAWRPTPNPTGKFGTPPRCPSGRCPEPPIRSPSLTSVSCASPTECIALGSGYGSFGFEWDGTKWTEIPALATDGVGSLSCPTSGPCLAVGGTTTVTISGTTVTKIKPPKTLTPGRGGLDAVDCPSPGQCVVLGTAWSDSGQSRQMGASWNGSTWNAQTIAAPPFALVKPDTVAMELGPCTSDLNAKVVTVELVPHRGFAAVNPTCQIVEPGQNLDIRNATNASATTSIGTTFVFTIRAGETAQLVPALSDVLAPGHHPLYFTGPNYGTGIDLWVGGRSQQPGYILTVSSTALRSTCRSGSADPHMYDGVRVVAAYTARTEQLSGSFPWSPVLSQRRPLDKWTVCEVESVSPSHGPSHTRAIWVVYRSGARLFATGAPTGFLIEPF